MNGSRKSDSFVVPEKPPNKGSGAPRPAEGVEEIVEVKLGYDGIVFVAAGQGALPGATLRDIYLGLARRVPDPAGKEVLVPNPYRTWREVNAALPDRPIRVYGPAAGSGTRHVFTRLAMEGGCKTFDSIKKNETIS